MALGLGESDKTTAKQILRRRQLPLKDFEQKTGVFTINFTFFTINCWLYFFIDITYVFSLLFILFYF